MVKESLTQRAIEGLKMWRKDFPETSDEEIPELIKSFVEDAMAMGEIDRVEYDLFKENPSITIDEVIKCINQ